MDVPLWIWAITVAVVLGMLVLDFVGHVRTPHAPGLREAGLWTAVWVVPRRPLRPRPAALSPAASPPESSSPATSPRNPLSVDNLFVFVLIMGKFAVPSLTTSSASC